MAVVKIKSKEVNQGWNVGDLVVIDDKQALELSAKRQVDIVSLEKKEEPKPQVTELLIDSKGGEENGSTSKRTRKRAVRKPA